MYYNALFDVPNEDGKLRIDMTAQVYIVLNEAKNVLTIPAAAIQSQRANRKDSSANGNKSSDQAKKPDAETTQHPKRLDLTEDDKALIAQGKASILMVRVLQADGTAQPQPVLIGLNNRVSAQVLKGLKQGDQVVIADASDSSNDKAKRSSQRPMGM